MEQINKEDKIFIGIKPIPAYLKGIEVQTAKNKKAIICARGKIISKLVNIAEISKRNGYKVESIVINSDPFKNKEGREVFVSSMEITLIR